MLAGPGQTGVFTVSLNQSIAPPTISQAALSTAPSLHSTLILPPPIQQVSQQNVPQLVSGGQIVNLTPVRAPEPRQNNPAVGKVQSCSFCQKRFSSRFNVTRHEKICKLNTSSTIASQSQNVNPSAEIKAYPCLFCQKIFSSQDSLTRHQKKCKNASNMVIANRGVPATAQQSHGRRQHICKFCGKEFSTKWNVIRHERLFHDPNDPVLPPQSLPSDMNTTILASPPGKPERYCRFCGNYFSSKYNAIRHEKICTRVQENSSNSQEQNSQQQSAQPQHITVQKSIQDQIVLGRPVGNSIFAIQGQITTITGNASGQPQSGTAPLLIQNQPQEQQQQQQQLQPQLTQPQPQQRSIQQVQQPTQIQTTNLQNVQQQHQILPQQTMLLIEQPTTPFHVCKFCNKQLSTRCDPVSHNLLPSMPTVATITGQPMQLSSTGTQLTGLVTPVMASLPQVALVQQQFPPIQGQQLIQQQTQLQQQKERLQQESNQQQQVTNQSTQPTALQQVNLQQLRIPQQQIQNVIPAQIQTTQQQIQTGQVIQIQQQEQQQSDQAQLVERPHACKYCEKHFATKWYLEQHEKIHTGEADMCKVCGKYFVTRWHLDKHMRVHVFASPAAKKSKKDSPSPVSSATVPVDNTLSTQVPVIPFSEHIMVEPGATTVSVVQHPIPSPVNRGAHPTSTSYGEVTPYFIAGDQHNSSQAASVASSTSQASNHSDEHSTIDKSQIASSLAISY